MLKTKGIVINSIIFFCCAFVFTACTYKTRNVLFKTAKKTNLDSVKTVYVVQAGSGVNVGPHHIESGDRLEIRNLSNPQLISGEPSAVTSTLQQNYQVGLDGIVLLPIIGKVNLTGLTVIDASNKLQELYSSHELVNPIIEVKVINLQATVLGEVNKPGNYILEHEETYLTDVLGLAGGTTARADLRQVKIVRGGQLNPQILLVNLRNINSLKDPRLIIQNHDVIYAEPNNLNGTGDQLQGFTAVLTPLIVVLNALLLVLALRR